MRFIHIYIIGCLGAFIILSGCKQELIELKLNFQIGDRYLYINEVHTVTTVMDVETKSMTEMGIIYELKSQSDTQKIFLLTYDYVKASTQNPMTDPVYFDSRKDSFLTNHQDLAAVVGHKVKLFMTNDGEVTQTEINEMQLSTHLNQTKEINTESAKEMVRNTFDMYPNKPVKVGDFWKKKSRFNMNESAIESQTTYELKSVKDGLAIVHLKAIVEMPDNDMLSSTARISMKGTQTGFIQLDINSGAIVFSEIEIVLKGTVSMQGQELPMQLKGKTITKSKRL